MRDKVTSIEGQRLNEHAFPGRQMAFIGDREMEVATLGLTKREYFAGLAMQKMIDFGSWDIREEIIKRSIDFADELLKQLEE